MPHAVVLGARPLPEVLDAWEPFHARIGDVLVKSEQAYLERGGRAALFPVMTIAGPLRQRFLVAVAAREDGLAVKLDPLTDPEKTPPVHLALALFALFVLRVSPEARIGPTNIAPALEQARGAVTSRAH